MDTVEKVAMSIYWAAFEMYPPNDDPLYGSVNPVSRMTCEQAWNKTSKEHKHLCLFQAQRAIEKLRAIEELMENQ